MIELCIAALLVSIGSVVGQYAMFRWLDGYEPTAGKPILAVRLSALPLVYSSRTIFPAQGTAAGRDFLAAPESTSALERLRQRGFRYVIYERRPITAGYDEPFERPEFVRSLREIHLEGGLTLYEAP
ncbi:MAG: hypothetical protein AUH85_00315 [Chloroflexi bacterium 13_1_40CM_4_68_4]|nr:MAG: hypothetical protein AUH85_00315 [Chloroflexi bacterium 13_1_40CM_4_68_4]